MGKEGVVRVGKRLRRETGWGWRDGRRLGKEGGWEGVLFNE